MKGKKVQPVSGSKVTGMHPIKIASNNPFLVIRSPIG